MELSIYTVDAFVTQDPCTGNPAAVIQLERWLSEGAMQQIARQNNLSETAFLVPRSDGPTCFDLRWFTPRNEVDLCGHATLAAGHVVLHHLAPGQSSAIFETRSGRLKVEQKEDGLSLVLPARAPQPSAMTPELCEALRARPQEVLMAVDALAVFPSAAQLRALRPDFDALCYLAPSGVIATAAGSDCDFVSRYFAPREGVPEDPVTGSAHCTLVPYWAEKLGKTELHARQLSDRGGELRCKLLEDGVELWGKARTYLIGTVFV